MIAFQKANDCALQSHRLSFQDGSPHPGGIGSVSGSIHSLEPIEVGGVAARHGFAVQDHVAAGLCLDMLEDATLQQVWCESQDDITLIWVNGGAEEVEFVQVKSNDFGQFWTIAKLVQKEARTDTNGKPLVSQCILEKSLQFDRCTETVRFRIVTCLDVKDGLELLKYERTSVQRTPGTANFAALVQALSDRVGGVRSPNGRGCSFWAESTLWCVVHSLDAIINSNLLRISKLGQALGQFLATDQANELYQKLVAKVFEAGLADPKGEPKKKKILRAELSQWFEDEVNRAVHPAADGTGKTLAQKLTEAQVAADAIESAGSMRHKYRIALLAPKYSDTKQRMKIEGEIEARLLALRSDLDCGNLPDNGVAFHARCLNEIKTVHDDLPKRDRPPLHHLVGFMYNLADRCTHRFIKASA